MVLLDQQGMLNWGRVGNSVFKPKTGHTRKACGDTLFKKHLTNEDAHSYSNYEAHDFLLWNKKAGAHVLRSVFTAKEAALFIDRGAARGPPIRIRIRDLGNAP